MKDTFKRSLFFAFSFALLSGGPLAQDSSRIVILSPRVGPKIDKAKSDYFRLFTKIENFESAEFRQITDSTYCAHIILKGKDGSERDSIINYDKMSVLIMVEKINHFEELAGGAYIMGTDPPKLRSVSDSQLNPTDRSRVSRQPATWNFIPNRLPLAPDSIDERLIIDYPRSGFGIGASSYSTDFTGLQSICNVLEDTYNKKGRSIKHYETSFGSSALLWLNFKIEISNAFALSLEAGTQLSGDVDFKAASFSLLYTIRDLPLSYFYPYVGVGIGHYRISTELHYGESIGNGVLEGIYVDAANIGYNFTAGIETGTNVIWNIYAGYLYVPVMNQTYTGIDTKLDISSAVLGGRVTIFF